MYKLLLRVNHVQTRSTDYVYGVTDDGVEDRASVARGPELSATGRSAPQGAPQGATQRWYKFNPA